MPHKLRPRSSIAARVKVAHACLLPVPMCCVPSTSLRSEDDTEDGECHCVRLEVGEAWNEGLCTAIPFENTCECTYARAYRSVRFDGFAHSCMCHTCSQASASLRTHV